MQTTTYKIQQTKYKCRHKYKIQNEKYNIQNTNTNTKEIGGLMLEEKRMFTKSGQCKIQNARHWSSRWERQAGLMLEWRMITKPGCAGPTLLLMPNGCPLKLRECLR